MTTPLHKQGLSTLLTHYQEIDNPKNAHLTPIYQTSTFVFPDVQTGADIFAGTNDGFSYTRVDNPNTRQLASKIAMLEGLDLISETPNAKVEDLVAGRVYASGMAAISTAVFACVKSGSTVLTQKILYGNAYNLMAKILPEYQVNVVWVDDFDSKDWEAAFDAHPEADLVFLETPANPTLDVIDIQQISTLAHQKDPRVIVDNTFATPYCQRPFNPRGGYCRPLDNQIPFWAWADHWRSVSLPSSRLFQSPKRSFVRVIKGFWRCCQPHGCLADQYRSKNF